MAYAQRDESWPPARDSSHDGSAEALPHTGNAAQATAHAGPVAIGERTLAPDLARGAMLLLIALANASGVALGGTGLEPHPEGLGRALNAGMTALVHARAYPVFALMFGYGLVQLAARQVSSGATPGQARALLLRRNAWLFAFGALHAALLYYGDFLGAYGIIGALATVLLIGQSDRVHRVVPWLWGLTALHTAMLAVAVGHGLAGATDAVANLPREVVPSLLAPTYVASVAARLAEWPLHTATVIPAIVVAWLGIWAARRGVLEEPGAHHRALGIVAVGCLGASWAGGIPLALAAAGFVAADADTVQAMVRLHQVSGTFGGPGYAAALALVAVAVTRGRSPWLGRLAGAVAALGRRSLSGYLLQSVAWLALFAPFTLHLGSRVQEPLPVSLLAASVVWMISVIAAAAMERRGYRGPAEVVLRRLVYRR
jgi:uncharacterized membrane protein YeiB